MKNSNPRRNFLKKAAVGLASGAILGSVTEAFASEQQNIKEAPMSLSDEFVIIDFEKTKPAILKWPSEKAVKEHLKLYAGYVRKSNEILGKLKSLDKDPRNANQIFSDIRALKADLSFALGGMKNHEIYFDILGGNGGKPTGKLGEMIQRDFGSLEEWMKDIKSTGIASRGWSWLAYDHDTKKLFNYLGDSQNTYPVWNCTPVVALDVYEHAYWMDFGANRAQYIDEWFNHLDWPAIEKRFATIQL